MRQYPTGTAKIKTDKYMYTLHEGKQVQHEVKIYFTPSAITLKELSPTYFLTNTTKATSTGKRTSRGSKGGSKHKADKQSYVHVAGSKAKRHKEAGECSSPDGESQMSVTGRFGLLGRMQGDGSLGGSQGGGGSYGGASS